MDARHCAQSSGFANIGSKCCGDLGAAVDDLGYEAVVNVPAAAEHRRHRGRADTEYGDELDTTDEAVPSMLKGSC